MNVEYKRSFYQMLGTDVPRSASEVVPRVLEFVTPGSVVDVGCGSGAWLAAFQRAGVVDVFGFDGPWVDPSVLQIPREKFQVVDLSVPLAATRRYDLVLCLEVAEHLPPHGAANLVASLVGLGPIILFSAAIPFQGGYHHFNEQWPDYWAHLFEKWDYVFVDAIRPVIWQNPNVEWWYAQNMFMIVHRQALEQNLQLAAAASATRYRQLALVHPRAFLESTVRARRPTELIQATLGSIKRALKRQLSR